MNQRLHAIISGRVQGVWYRASTVKEANRLGLAGWVRNRRDGCVELVAEGDREKLDDLVKWYWQGPTAAKVSSVDEGWSEATGEFADFETRPTA